MESAEAKYAHLLQPIRELTKNWEIDLASDLTEYLEELDEMTITFDGGKNNLNFAAAALLIQGSTCIYSKKVEHLHNLVFQTLEYISDRKKQGKRGASEEETGQDGTGRQAARHEDDDDDMFQSLDDMEETSAEQVNMRNEISGRVEVVPLPPESLLPPDAVEKRKLPLISLTGDIVASCKDFRMNTFTPGADGVLRLVSESSRANFLRNVMQNAPLDHNNGAPAWPDAAGPAAGDAGSVLAVSEDGGENLLPMQDVEEMEPEPEPEEHIDRQAVQAAAAGEGRVLRVRPDIQPQKEHDCQRAEEAAARVWKKHDPFEPIGEVNPEKLGKCHRVPSGLDDDGKRKRAAPSAPRDFWCWFTNTYDAEYKPKAGGPTFPDLNNIYLSKLKDRLETKKRIFKKMAPWKLREEEFAVPGERPDLEDLENDLGNDFSDNEHDPLGDIADEGAKSPLVADLQIDGMSYEELVKKSVEQFLVQTQEYAQESDLSRRVKDWEEKMLPELARQEERPAFDIHDYGDRIVAAFEEVGEKKSFASIVRGLDNFEACKYMLASLQLANDYTVEIDRSEGLEESIDTMELQLLSRKRAHERFKHITDSAAI